ncbi:MAG: flagellar export chaperone FliS [Lachnospiraceae bacterium]|nr:flagellar export chaperone FliS [Lachnospiraceae bacterium]MBD5482555.1 flagellar export chaperone FliS [Lachnospiraceae bacterium]
MMLNNPYAQYTNNRIATASPGELTLMLYEGAIKFCNIGIIAIDEQNIQKSHDNIMKAEAIVRELRLTLNHKYPIANDFENVYNYLIRRLHEANMHKDKEILEEVNTHLRSMRDTWKEVLRLCRSGEANDPQAQLRA